jgi:hypothetical protein
MIKNIFYLTFILVINIYSTTTIPDQIGFGGVEIDMGKFQAKERVLKEVLWYSKDRSGHLHNLFRKLEYYKSTIFPVFEEYGVDRDYIFVAAVESSFDFRRVSSKKASGPWQFLKSTAKMYKLAVNRGIDERNHPIKSTEAFCKHIKKLEKRYKGDPVKILSAYNSGERALNESLLKQSGDSFWDIISNFETSRYFPKILALKIIFEDLEEYGVELDEVEVDFRDSYREITFSPDSNLSFNDLAEMMGVSYREFYYANPHINHKGYRRGGVLREGVSYDLFVPNSSLALFEQLRLSSSEIEGDTLMVDVDGRSIGELALIYGKSWRDIAKENGLEIIYSENGLESVDLDGVEKVIIVK